MIIKKNIDGTYVCENEGNYYTIGSKQYYLDQLKDVQTIIEPTDKELIELGKQSHPFYQKDNSINNLSNQLLEIEEFENGNKL